MKLTKKQKKLIRSYRDLEIAQIAKKVKAQKEDVEKYLSKFKVQKKKNVKVDKTAATVRFENLKDILKFIKRNLKYFALFAIVILAVYANGINGELVSDDIAVSNTPTSNDIMLALKSRTIGALIFAVSQTLFGKNPIPLHLASVFMHIIVSFLVFTFLRTIFTRKQSIVATILFILHPVNVEAVTWISGSAYLIRAIYTFTILIFYHLYIQNKNWKYFVVAFLIFLLQMFTVGFAQNLVVLPLIIVYEYFIEKERFKFKNLLKYVPYLIVYALFLLNYKSSITSRLEATDALDPTRDPYIQTLGYSLYKTVSLLFAPIKLSLYHDTELITDTTLFFMYSSIILIGLYILKNLFLKKDSYFAWVLFIIASILYMLSPLQIAWFIAERYLYIATIGFAAIITIFLFKVESGLKIKNFVLIAATIISLLYATRVVVRNMDWKTRKSLWEATIREYPGSARAYNNLGDVYAKEGNMEKSIAAFEKAIALQPGYPDAVHNLGYTYYKNGDIEKAEKQFLEAYSLNPNLYQSVFYLAAIEFDRGNFEKALEYNNRALEINPTFEPAINGDVLIKQKILELEGTTIEE